VIREVVPPLFASLVDDAGLFPPEELPMPAALARHLRDEAAGHPVLTSRFLCPAGRLNEMLAALPPGALLPLGLIRPLDRAALRGSIARIAGSTRVRLVAVEGPMDDLAALAAVPDGVPCYVEVPITGDWPNALRMLADAGHAAKVRCSGVRADLFPSVEQLAGFVHACAQVRVAFKATAGLHHALPYRDQHTGFTHHGFLNLLLAACRAAGGSDVDEVVAVLRTSDPTHSPRRPRP